MTPGPASPSAMKTHHPFRSAACLSLGLNLGSGVSSNSVQGYGRTNDLLSSAFDSIIITNQP